MTYDRSFTRRDFITTSVALATTLHLQRAAHALGLTPDADVCRLMPEQEVGPFYVAGELLRSDIVEGKPGVPLDLRLIVLDARTCKPLPGAAVDIWHCDALGLYAGFTTQSPGAPGGPGGGGPSPGNMGPPPGNLGSPPESHPTDALTFLRGIQITGADGSVNFSTVFPGFYMGRTNHIHFKVRIGGHAGGKSYEAGHTSHVGQVFFPEDVAVRLMQHEPYRKHLIHRTTQTEDGVFGGQHGDLSIARLEQVHPDDITAGLRANLVAAVDPTATPAPAQRMGFGGPPPA
jgi:protocatechuate 3,4-dioxygenase beta subunit